MEEPTRRTMTTANPNHRRGRGNGRLPGQSRNDRNPDNLGRIRVGNGIPRRGLPRRSNRSGPDSNRRRGMGPTNRILKTHGNESFLADLDPVSFAAGERLIRIVNPLSVDIHRSLPNQPPRLAFACNQFGLD
jgi:hypothetical protein